MLLMALLVVVMPAADPRPTAIIIMIVIVNQDVKDNVTS
jgi:hypothetical protein